MMDRLETVRRNRPGNLLHGRNRGRCDLLWGQNESARPKLPRAWSSSEDPSAVLRAMRPGWSLSNPRLSAWYAGATCFVDLSRGRHALSSGEWGMEVEINGLPVRPTSDWARLCRVSDRDGDYLELEISLERGVRVERQMYLAREDRFLFLADAIFAERPSSLRYCGRLPWCKAGSVGGKTRVVVIPLALPERTADHDGGILRRTDSGLELCMNASGRALYAPLWIDLERRRFGKPVAWRQLTVAEHGIVQPRDAAAGYRAAVGRRQWLFYRSLGPRGNRTLLGHNLVSETLIARFRPDGEVEPLIEIE